MRPIVTDRVAWSVGLSVCLSGGRSNTLVSPAKRLNRSFRLRIRVGPGNHTCWGFRSPMGRGNFEGEGASHCKVLGHSAVICAKTAEQIEMRFGLWAGMAQGIMF